MNNTFKIISEIIRNRRSISPQFYKAGKIPDELLMSILESARWAPTHKKTQPWRFVVIRNDARNTLSHLMSEHYKNTTSSELYTDIKYQKAGEKPLQCDTVIAICIHRSPDTLIPEWEETAALGCSVQNMWLASSAAGLGAYWSTPNVIHHLDTFLELAPEEHCLGLFYMGWKSEVEIPDSTRMELDQIVRFMN